MNVVVCPICKGNLKAKHVKWVKECIQCDLLINIYNKDFKNTSVNSLILNEVDREYSLELLRKENFREILEIIKKLNPETTLRKLRILDVGSAHGWFLSLAKEDGFEIMGIEPNLSIAKRSSPEIFDHVKIGFFPDCLGEDERFDIIIFNDVFEHLIDIHAASKSCFNHLSDNGILVLNIPNSEGFFFRLSSILSRAGVHGPYTRMWQRDFPSPHFYYFNTKNLRHLITNVGFKEIFSKNILSVKIKGLWPRIRYDKNSSFIKTIIIWFLVLISIPFLVILPSDIKLQIFRKSIN